MEIGEEDDAKVVEPLEQPEPFKRPAAPDKQKPTEKPVKVPEREKVPA